MSKKRHFKRKFAVETYKSHAAKDVLSLALQELGWENVTAASTGAQKNNCDIYWRGPDPDDASMSEKSYVARIPGMSAIGDKGELSMHISRLRQFFPDEFSFYPRTWLLPEEMESFEAYAVKNHGIKRTYIVKPSGGAQGEGIYLIQHPRQLHSLQVSSIVQEYITKPLLIKKLKFDLRLYVLITGLNPLKVYLSRSGMGRFCTLPYEAPNVKNMHQTFMHLTNYSLNKRSKDFVVGSEGSKQTLDTVFRDMEAEGHDTEELWSRIRELVSKTVIAVLPQLMVEERAFKLQCSPHTPPHSFQLVGFDILVDENLKPYLMEVNGFPSLRIDSEQEIKPGVVEYLPSQVDIDIKLPVVKDTLKIIRAIMRSEETSGYCGSFSELLPLNSEAFSHLNVFEKCAKLFSLFVGIRGGVRMGSTAFRTFSRQCSLCAANFTSADVDILYIRMTQCFNTHERNALPFHGFCIALLTIANKRYGNESLPSLQKLLDDCERAVK